MKRCNDNNKEEALKLVQESGSSVSKIAWDLGISNSAAFCTDVVLVLDYYFLHTE